MSDTKIQCNKCGAKFFALSREEIECKCGHQITVKEYLKNHNATTSSRKNQEDEDLKLGLDDKEMEIMDEDDLL